MNIILQDDKKVTINGVIRGMQGKKHKIIQAGLFAGLFLLLLGMSSLQAEAANSKSAAKTVKVKSVKLNKKKMAVYKGQTKKLVVTIAPKKASNQKVSWKSKNRKIAAVNKKGEITGVSLGTTYVTVTSKADKKKQATCRIVVKAAPVKKVQMKNSSVQIEVGKSKTMTYSIKPAYAVNQAVKWTTSNKKVATVSAKGKVTVKKKGKAVITCISKENSKKRASCTVTGVVKAQSVKLQYNAYRVLNHVRVKLSATVLPQTTTNKSITWMSSDPDIVKVSQSGNIKGKKAGVATITAVTENGHRATCKVTVAKVEDEAAAIVGITEADALVKGIQITNHRPIRNMLTGTYYSVTGIIASVYPLSHVTVEVVDKKGIVYTAYQAAPNATTFDLCAEADPHIGFNLLKPGTYYYRVWVTDEKDTYKMLVCERFDVVENWTDELYLKQLKGSENCTSVSVAMMLRSYANMYGMNGNSITLKSVEDVCWIPNQGLKSYFSYRNPALALELTVTRDQTMKLSGMTMEQKKQYLKDLLKVHPEGFVIYDENTPHAVFLTDYDAVTDMFYIADPVDRLDYLDENAYNAKYQNNYGRVPLSRAYIDGDDTVMTDSGQEQIIAVLDKVWYILPEM